MKMSFYDQPRLQDWTRDNTRERGATKKNLKYIREIRELHEELAINAMLLYFSLATLEVQESRRLLKGVSGQKALLRMVEAELKEYRLENKWISMFDREIENIRKRVEFVRKICKENIRLSKYHPFFEEFGYDTLLMFTRDERLYEEQTVLAESIQKWEVDNQEKIDAHLKSIEKELEIRDSNRRLVRAALDREKAEVKAAKKAEDDEIKEMNKNAKEYAKRQRKIEKSFE